MATEPASLLQDTPRIAGSHPHRETEPVDYATLNAVWGALLAGVVLATRDRGARDPISGPELIPLSAATFALSKVIAREKIGSWVREPFVEDEPEDGQRPRGGGARAVRRGRAGGRPAPARAASAPRRRRARDLHPLRGRLERPRHRRA